MKKLLMIMAILLPSFILSSCSDDDVELTSDTVIGTWDVVWAEAGGESTDVPEGYIYIRLDADGAYRTTMFGDSYIGEYTIDGNTVVGTTLDPITEYYTFTSLNGNTANIAYSNSVGDRYNFRAEKR